LEIVEHRTAGSPQDEEIFWTHYNPKDIQEKMLEKGFAVSRYDVNNLMIFFKYKRRSLVKTKTYAQVEGRNEQFEKIAQLKETFLEAGCPVFSIDTKKKEFLGDFYRSGTYYGTKSQTVYDHDFSSYATGKIVPHGIYDIADNRGYVFFWEQILQWKYSGKKWILFLCDSGGSNNCRHYLFKEDLYKLAQRIQMNILVAHYPTYCSKYNPIEHRLFCHVHRAWQGTVFKNIQIVKELAQQTTTKTGLSVEVRINEKDYTAKRSYKQEFKENINQYISFDENSPKWNYSVFHKPL